MPLSNLPDRQVCCRDGLCLICSTLVVAQGTGGRILGRVADPSGAVLADAKVKLTNEATGVSRRHKRTAAATTASRRWRWARTR